MTSRQHHGPKLLGGVKKDVQTFAEKSLSGRRLEVIDLQTADKEVVVDTQNT